MEPRMEGAPDERQEEEFVKRDGTYIIPDRPVNERFYAEITPREGFFDLEVYRNEYEYVRDDDIGVHVEGHREEYLNSRELTVDNIRTAVRDFEIAVPDSLANELTEWQEKYWDGNEIEKGYMPEGAEAPEEISERLRLEFGSALAEAQGVAEFAPKEQGLIQRDGYSEYVRGGETIHYIVDLGDYAHVKIEPTQGVFDVEVNEVRFADVTCFPEELPAGVVPGEAYIAQHLKTLEPTVEDVQKALDERGINIKIPNGLVEVLSEWRREFLESEGYAEVMHMAATEVGDDIRTVDLKGELKNVLVEIVYNDMSAVGAEERRIGTTDLAQETLSRADLVGIEADPKMKIMVQALRDIADADHTKDAHVIAEDALAEVGRMSTPATEVEASEWNVSPDERFPTLEVYEAALERMRRREWQG